MECLNSVGLGWALCTFRLQSCLIVWWERKGTPKAGTD